MPVMPSERMKTLNRPGWAGREAALTLRPCSSTERLARREAS